MASFESPIQTPVIDLPYYHEPNFGPNDFVLPRASPEIVLGKEHKASDADILKVELTEQIDTVSELIEDAIKIRRNVVNWFLFELIGR